MKISSLRQVVVVYSVSLVIFPLLAAASLLGLVGSFTSNLFIYGSLLEFFLLGFVPLVFALANHDDPKTYGLTRSGLVRSLGLGLTLVGLRASVNYALGEPPFVSNLRAFSQAIAQPFPYNIGLALFSGFTYGPLEVFYIVFLVVKLDQSLALAKRHTLSRGSLIGVALWALLHLNNAFFNGLPGAIEQVVTNFVFGTILVAIFKYSGNSIGPMLCFTLANIAQ